MPTWLLNSWWAIILVALQAWAGIRFGWRGLIASSLVLGVGMWLGFKLMAYITAPPPTPGVVDFGPDFAGVIVAYVLLVGLVVVGIALLIAHLLLKLSGKS
jgi:hypothetical protein